MRPPPPSHPDVLAARDRYHAATVAEVAAAIDEHPVVVVGMAWNWPAMRLRAFLRRRGIGYHYLGYGNYLWGWRRRLAIKLWTGWPTFPQVFVRGVFVGGGSDVGRLAKSGELQRLLDEPR